MVKFSLIIRQKLIETTVGFRDKKRLKLWLDLLQFQDKNSLKEWLDFPGKKGLKLW